MCAYFLLFCRLSIAVLRSVRVGQSPLPASLQEMVLQLRTFASQRSILGMELLVKTEACVTGSNGKVVECSDRLIRSMKKMVASNGRYNYGR